MTNPTSCSPSSWVVSVIEIMPTGLSIAWYKVGMSKFLSHFS